MNILFIHQNFPGQFKFLAPALLQQGHTVVAMTMQKTEAKDWLGVKLVPYNASRGTTPNVHPWVSDFETKTIRGEACFRAALKLKAEGFTPDVIIAHPGWGESLFLKDVWPQAKLGIYCEFYYHPHGADVGFDPEFPVKDEGDVCRLRLKNLNNLLHFEVADAGMSPTQWQASTFPEPFRSHVTVVHDGIDTEAVAPNAGVSLTLNGNITLTRADEVVTFVSRNLEPYRGYHIFMRALPELLKRRPQARKKKGSGLAIRQIPATIIGMARPLRIELAGGLYHVTSRGDRRDMETEYKGHPCVQHGSPRCAMGAMAGSSIGRKPDKDEAKGILLAALGMLARYYGYERGGNKKSVAQLSASSG